MQEWVMTSRFLILIKSELSMVLNHTNNIRYVFRLVYKCITMHNIVAIFGVYKSLTKNDKSTQG